MKLNSFHPILPISPTTTGGPTCLSNGCCWSPPLGCLEWSVQLRLPKKERAVWRLCWHGELGSQTGMGVLADVGGSQGTQKVRECDVEEVFTPKEKRKWGVWWLSGS